MLKKKTKGIIILFILICLIISGFYGIKYSMGKLVRSVYKTDYMDIVQTYADEYMLDPYFILAVIKTESDFKADAVSNVGARGLMQIMESTFDWIKTKIPDKDILYDDLFEPAENIKIGAFLLSYLYKEFKSDEVTLAAYHAGRTAVNGWLKDAAYSSDGKSLHAIPIDDTGHYVGKVMKYYQNYKKFYKEN